MELNIESRMSGGGKDPVELIGRVKNTIRKYFAHCPVEVGNVRFVVQEAKFGGDAQKLIKLSAPIKAAEVHPEAVTVNVYTYGSQAAIGFMIVQDHDAEKLKDLLMKGPYNKKPRRKNGEATDDVHLVATPVAAAVAEIAPVVEVPPVQLPVVPSVVVSEVVPQAPRLTPLEKLRAGGFPEEDIERLKATLSVILQEEMVRQGLAEVPNTLRVKVRDITAAIIDHMRLPRSSAGTYRGIVGAFYSSRITLFALKYDEQDKGDEMYADWLFDCDLVVDFIGGKDQLEALARIRRQEVSEREAKEATREPAPPAAVVEEAVLQDSLTDEAAVALTLKWLEGKKDAQQAVALAQENLASHEERLARLLAQVEEAKVAVEGAKELVKVAEKKFSALELSEEVRTRLREAKERVLSLCSQVGI